MISPETRANQLTRRELLKAGGGLLAIAGSYSISKITSEVYRQQVISERSKRIPPTSELIQNIPDYSIGVGFCPDQNKTETGFLLASELNTYPNYFGYFLNNTSQDWLFTEIKSCMESGVIPVIKFGFYRGLTSRQNGFFEMLGKITEEFEKQNRPYILSPFFEFPSPWSKSWWGMEDITHTEFISGWREMYSYIHNSSDNAHIALCFNSSMDIDPFDPIPFEPWFPGEDFVDILGLDIYNKSDDNPFSLEHYAFQDYSPKVVIGPDIAHLHTIAPNIPKAVFEINYFQQNRKAKWLGEAIDYLPRIGVNTWMSFDWDKPNSGIGETWWSPKHYPDLVETYSQEFQRSIYISNNPSLRANPEATIQLLYRNPFTV